MPPARRLPAIRLTSLVAAALAAVLTLTLPPAAHAQGGALRGPDVSSHQHPHGHSIDWGRVKSGGSDFAFVKATEGRTYTNPYFARDYASLAAHDIVRGAYHFARPGGGGTNARAQARYFVRTAGSLTGAGELPPVLDLETTGGLRPTALISWTRAYLREVQLLTGRKPIVYTYPSFWRTAMADTHAFTSYPLWIATYTGPAQLIGGWHRYLFWQHTDHASIAGIPTAVDGNVFAGTRAQLLRLAHTVTAPAAPTRLAARPETAGSPKVDVTWRAAAAGGRPDTYRVRIDGRQAATVNAGSSDGTVAWSTRLAPGTHTITVAAHNTAGLSAPAQTTVKVVVRPGPPTDLQVATAGLRLTAAWAPPAQDAGELTGYRVRLDDKAPVTLRATATSYSAKGLATGPHTLQVVAYNTVGESRASTRSATVVIKPGAPTHLSLSVAGTTVTSRWDPPSSAGGELLGYHVRIDDAAPVTVPAGTPSTPPPGWLPGRTP
ncbi:GH25 family lysozyme [Nocardioides ungokensis]|uniref:GH25 family lysozyme n=1 Tax=Nocardioides ungokensis TaxID=1643322 RepID=UPI001C610D80|nr:GH25 family lysozyme [Nocardioides ungokensis]